MKPKGRLPKLKPTPTIVKLSKDRGRVHKVGISIHLLTNRRFVNWCIPLNNEFLEVLFMKNT